MFKFLNKITGLPRLSRNDKGRTLLYLVAFIPMIYKLISPFFILAGLSYLTIIIVPTMVITGVFMCREDLQLSIKKIHILLYFIIVTALAISPLLHPETKTFVEDNYFKFVYGVLSFLFIGALIDYQRDWYILRFVARMGVIVQVFWQTCLILGLVETELSTGDSLGEQMESAYQLLFPICLLYLCLAKEKKTIDFIAVIIGTFLLFAMGARGPIVIYLIFVVGYFVFFKKYKKNGSFIKSLTVLSFAFIYYNLELILLAIIPLVQSIGFSTRVFSSILNDQMTNLENSSYRDDFYGSVLNPIINDPTGFGYGWGADRLFTPTHGYVHNLELELLCQFGSVGGSIILILIFIAMLKKYIIVRKFQLAPVWYLFFCSGFLALQFSYSYILYPMFFIFVGYNISYTGLKRIK